MRKIIAAATILTLLTGCVVTSVGDPYEQRLPPQSYNVIPPPGPGYAPPYPPYAAYQPPPPVYRHEWVTDTPHWQPGDE